jgi:NADP-dependent 3-hydroxy acid dehydrogenase YdfG
MAASRYRSQNVHDLTGLVAVVTGGGTGIGLMITKGLAANGAKVYITGRRKDVLEKLAESWDGEGAIIP